MENKRIIRPSFNSIILYMIGFFIGLIIFFLEKQQIEYKYFTLFACLFFLILIIYRLTLKYVINENCITKKVFLNLLAEKTLTLSNLKKIEVFQGINGRLFGFAILWLETDDPCELGFTVVGIKNYKNFVEEFNIYIKNK